MAQQSRDEANGTCTLNIAFNGIELDEESTSKIIFKVEIPQDSRARTKDVGVTMIVKGKILPDTANSGNAADSTAKLMEW